MTADKELIKEVAQELWDTASSVRAYKIVRAPSWCLSADDHR